MFISSHSRGHPNYWLPSCYIFEWSHSEKSRMFMIISMRILFCWFDRLSSYMATSLNWLLNWMNILIRYSQYLWLLQLLPTVWNDLIVSIVKWKLTQLLETDFYKRRYAVRKTGILCVRQFNLRAFLVFYVASWYVCDLCLYLLGR